MISGVGRISKRPKANLPKADGDCPNGGQHMYQMYGAAYEVCVKCGKQHSMIVEWRRNIVEGDGNKSHPYVEAGIWSSAQLIKYMKMK